MGLGRQSIMTKFKKLLYKENYREIKKMNPAQEYAYFLVICEKHYVKYVKKCSNNETIGKIPR